MRNRTRHLWDDDEDDEDDEEEEVENCPTKIRRMKGHSYDHLDKVQLVNKGYLCMPDKMWTDELSKEKKDFVISFNSRICFGATTNNMDKSAIFAKVFEERSSGEAGEKITRRKFGLNLEHNTEDEEKK
eukprot:884919-Ditylum_brightwellii.AAC.1